MAWWKGIAIRTPAGLLTGTVTAVILVSVLWEDYQRHVDSALGPGGA
jgi:hypothetical protein